MSFITDMGSEAYQNIYDLLELDKKLMDNATLDKTLPLTIRRFTEQRIDGILNLREVIESEIKAWITLVALKQGGKQDVQRLDEMFNHVLSERGMMASPKATPVPA